MSLVTNLAFFKVPYPNKWWHPLFSYTSAKSQGPLEPCFTLSSIARTSLPHINFMYCLFNLSIFPHVYTTPLSLLLPPQWSPSSILRGYELATAIGVYKNITFFIFFKSTWAWSPAAHVCPPRFTAPQITGQDIREAHGSHQAQVQPVASGASATSPLIAYRERHMSSRRLFQALLVPHMFPSEALLLPRKCRGAGVHHFLFLFGLKIFPSLLSHWVTYINSPLKIAF